MNDPQLAAALRARSPEAFPDLLDTYGDRLFSYSWQLLRNRENAQIVVRDALVVAAVQIRRLVYDEWLGLWLYSLARAECLRREAVPASDADELVTLRQQDDADSRLMAWNAVTSMPVDEVEALDLVSRHDVDLRLVLGLSAAEVQALLERARRDLERALDAEILIRTSRACPDRPAVLRGWTGTTTPALRDRVLEHAGICVVCGPNLPRSVSPARVFALLPAPALSAVARLEILEFFGDSRMAAYREYAVGRAAELTGSWFLNTFESAPRLDSEPPAGSWFLPAPKPVLPPIRLTPAEPPEPADLAEPAESPEPAERAESPQPAERAPSFASTSAASTSAAPAPDAASWLPRTGTRRRAGLHRKAGLASPTLRLQPAPDRQQIPRPPHPHHRWALL